MSKIMQSAWRNRHLGNAALGAGLAYATSRYNSNANKFIAKNVKKYSKPTTRKRKPTRARGSGGYRKRSFRGGRSKKSSNIKMPAFGSKASSNIMKGRASKINKKFIKLESSKYTNQIITPMQYLSTQGNQNNTVDPYIGEGGANDLATQMIAAGQFYNTTAGSNVEDVPAPNYVGQKFLLETLKRTTTYTNQSPVKVTMCIYDLVAKQNSTGISNPATLWGQGGTDDAGTGSNSTNVPDADPRISKNFNIFWKVSKKTRVVLEPGREFVHVFGKTFNKLIDYEWINNFTCLQGITMVQMIVLYGGLVDDNPLATGSSNVTLAPAKVVAMQRSYYSLRQVTVFPRKQVSSTTMVTTHANAFWAQDEGTDAPVTVISNTGAGVNYA